MPDIFGHDEMSVKKKQKCLGAYAGEGVKVQDAQMMEFNQWIKQVLFKIQDFQHTNNCKPPSAIDTVAGSTVSSLTARTTMIQDSCELAVDLRDDYGDAVQDLTEVVLNDADSVATRNQTVSSNKKLITVANVPFKTHDAKSKAYLSKLENMATQLASFLKQATKRKQYNASEIGKILYGGMAALSPQTSFEIIVALLHVSLLADSGIPVDVAKVSYTVPYKRVAL